MLWLWDRLVILGRRSAEFSRSYMGLALRGFDMAVSENPRSAGSPIGWESLTTKLPLPHNLSVCQHSGDHKAYDEMQRPICINPLTPTVAIWVQLEGILCQTALSRHL